MKSSICSRSSQFSCIFLKIFLCQFYNVRNLVIKILIINYLQVNQFRSNEIFTEIRKNYILLQERSEKFIWTYIFLTIGGHSSHHMSAGPTGQGSAQKQGNKTVKVFCFSRALTIHAAHKNPIITAAVIKPIIVLFRHWLSSTDLKKHYTRSSFLH